MKKSMLALGTLILVAGSLSQAAVLRQKCDFQDFQILTNALENGQIREGAERKLSLMSVLSEEMGPTCTTVMNTEVRVSIPGQRLATFEIANATSRFTISVVTDRINNRLHVRIR